MGRLPALGLVLVACNEPTSTGGSRSEAVTSSAAASVAPSVVATHAVPSSSSAPRVLCSPTPGRVLSKVAPLRVDVTGDKSDGKINLKAAKVTWVDFFASWCGPCKEELPRIESFASRLSKDGVDVQIVHVSLDDDLRQLTAFFAAQPAMKSSLWLADGPSREGFLASLKMKPAPSLPEHAIVGQDGVSRCFVEGALTDGDYPELASVLKK